MNKNINSDVEDKARRLSLKKEKHIVYNKSEIIFISTFPPKVCGIATYTQDLIKSLHSKFGESFETIICPMETEGENYEYEEHPEYKLNISDAVSFLELAEKINRNDNIQLVMLQHEFGFFNETKNGLSLFLQSLKKEIIITFHTVLPNPDIELKTKVRDLADFSKSIVVMTDLSAEILSKDYNISSGKITVIPHGTHLLPFTDKNALKEKYGLKNKKVLSTFGLLGSGKNIETTLKALPHIVAQNPNVIFLILGKTHPAIVRSEGEKYRDLLENLTCKLHLENHIRFINEYLPLPELLEYLQLTDIYLFTSKDRNQAVSGTFSYAISCGCAIVSTPIPHALEVLKEETGIIIDFEAPKQLAFAVNTLLKNENNREKLRTKSLQKMAPTAWENSSILHALLFQKFRNSSAKLKYVLPKFNLDHIQNITTDFGMIQFAKISEPDIDSGYTLDDNARAMIALCKHYKVNKNKSDLQLISIYLNFIKFCQQKDGSFLNYVDKEKQFTRQNYETNLEDSNGRAVWALGYLISLKEILPQEFYKVAEAMLQKNLAIAEKIYSTRAMAFIIKGLYYQNSEKNIPLLEELANRLVKMYQHEAKGNWLWFEGYLTYGNSVLPEALLFAWVATKNEMYKQIAEKSFAFLLSKIIVNDTIKVISNQGWLQKESKENNTSNGGEQPIDVAYTILALSSFYKILDNEKYLQLMQNSFNWFLGKNQLNQIIYNPVTGGCYDGLEENNVNINQGAESTVSYLMARLSMDFSKSKTYDNI
ncbi:glycosyltransferase [Chryseobacterium geocarposphaerae]|uniref:Glycosyltransferase involved in cell wall biosynthesis n=1 Tax=Chryseobacterium geocarposphaerae TaxID=1416776 RepID=A0A2M9C962_9FLAO|nr:glycosyltransferase [Chryseobacterium geocarposphaerae]PJJ67314.1 glycosyltransferase involved in cell wall biosynthesis [Chryseobacterium geocarposphaerae]